LSTTKTFLLNASLSVDKETDYREHRGRPQPWFIVFLCVCGECFWRKKWHGRQNPLRICPSARSKAFLSGSRGYFYEEKIEELRKVENLTL